MSLMKLFAPCEAGLEGVLADELASFGARNIVQTRRGVSFDGGRNVLVACNLQSRLANRILVQLQTFRVRDRDDLYSAASRIPWGQWISPDHTIAVDSRGGLPNLPSNLMNQVVKDAICDRARREEGRRPDVLRQNPDVPISAHLAGDMCTLSLDSSGARLHRRGYRTRGGPAPLKETLAAGLLALAGWNGERPFLDPMCGSGTLAIEAAMIARRIAPGLSRLGGEGFALTRWRGHDAKGFAIQVDRIRGYGFPKAQVPIIASDVDTGAVYTARANAEEAGVSETVEFEVCDVHDVQPLTESGVLVTNLPYGERLEADGELEQLHRAVGDTLKSRFSGWHAWLLVANEHKKNIGLRPSGRTPLNNGGIDCRLLHFELYAGSRKKED